MSNRQKICSIFVKIAQHVERLLLKEGNPMSLVFQNIDPPPPSPPVECVPPAFVVGGGGGRTNSPAERGVGVNISEDERHRIALLQ
jgi:hypothetical protein